jgi:hypothetical protein
MGLPMGWKLLRQAGLVSFVYPSLIKNITGTDKKPWLLDGDVLLHATFGQSREYITDGFTDNAWYSFLRYCKQLRELGFVYVTVFTGALTGDKHETDKDRDRVRTKARAVVEIAYLAFIHGCLPGERGIPTLQSVDSDIIFPSVCDLAQDEIDSELMDVIDSYLLKSYYTSAKLVNFVCRKMAEHGFKTKCVNGEADHYIMKRYRDMTAAGVISCLYVLFLIVGIPFISQQSISVDSDFSPTVPCINMKKTGRLTFPSMWASSPPEFYSPMECLDANSIIFKKAESAALQNSNNLPPDDLRLVQLLFAILKKKGTEGMLEANIIVECDYFKGVANVGKVKSFEAVANDEILSCTDEATWMRRLKPLKKKWKSDELSDCARELLRAKSKWFNFVVTELKSCDETSNNPRAQWQPVFKGAHLSTTNNIGLSGDLTDTIHFIKHAKSEETNGKTATKKKNIYYGDVDARAEEDDATWTSVDEMLVEEGDESSIYDATLSHPMGKVRTFNTKPSFLLDMDIFVLREWVLNRLDKDGSRVSNFRGYRRGMLLCLGGHCTAMLAQLDANNHMLLVCTTEATMKSQSYHQKILFKMVIDAVCDCPGGNSRTCVHICCDIFSYLEYLSFFGIAKTLDDIDMDLNDESPTSRLCVWIGRANSSPSHLKLVQGVVRKPMASIDATRLVTAKEREQKRKKEEANEVQEVDESIRDRSLAKKMNVSVSKNAEIFENRVKDLSVLVPHNSIAKYFLRTIDENIDMMKAAFAKRNKRVIERESNEKIQREERREKRLKGRMNWQITKKKRIFTGISNLSRIKTNE